MCLAQRLETDLRPVGKTDHDVLLLLLFKLLLTCLTYGCVGVCVCVRDAGAGEVQRVLGVFWIPASISSYAAAHHDAVHRSSACFSRRFRWYLSTLTRAQKLWDRRTDPRRRRRGGRRYLYSRMLYKADLHKLHTPFPLSNSVQSHQSRFVRVRVSISNCMAERL
jgi:hypothetical protein